MELSHIERRLLLTTVGVNCDAGTGAGSADAALLVGSDVPGLFLELVVAMAGVH